MIIQITNNCTMGCPHCLQDSKVGDYHMTGETFENALRFSKFMGTSIYHISGGEPTTHPKFGEFARRLNEYMDEVFDINPEIPNIFFIESNGEFIRSHEKVAEMKEITRLKYFKLLQICSIRGLYKNYDFISKYQKNIEKAFGGKVFVYTCGITAMKDLGRAKNNELMLRKVSDSPYYMSCINASLAAVQCDSPKVFSFALNANGRSCTPMVDWRGDVHMSESITCQSVGNVNTDSFDEIYGRMRSIKPCGRCLGYKKFMESGDAKIVAARRILGLKS